MFYTWGASRYPPNIWMPHVFRCPLMPPYVQIPPVYPQCSPVHLHVIRGCGALLLFGHLPCVWMPAHVSNTPMHLYAPLYVYVLGVIACAMGGTSHILGAGRFQHICQAFGVCQYIHWMSIIHNLVPFL